eukprot:scaffold100863_cov57-Phaeocystis_antarctica.AAC.3
MQLVAPSCTQQDTIGRLVMRLLKITPLGLPSNVSGTPTLGLYQPRALCAVAPPLLPGLRGEEDVWRGFRAPPRAPVWASLHGWCS